MQLFIIFSPSYHSPFKTTKNNFCTLLVFCKVLFSFTMFIFISWELLFYNLALSKKFFYIFQTSSFIRSTVAATLNLLYIFIYKSKSWKDRIKLRFPVVTFRSDKSCNFDFKSTGGSFYQNRVIVVQTTAEQVDKCTLE